MRCYSAKRASLVRASNIRNGYDRPRVTDPSSAFAGIEGADTLDTVAPLVGLPTPKEPEAALRYPHRLVQKEDGFMKFSICLAVAALTLSATAYAQTSQTFRFGEGQSTLPSGNAHPAPAPGAQAQQPQAQQQPQSAAHARAKAKPKHKAKHHRGHVTQPDTYSHN
jgi:hypothetical protein